jgi:hypothetical protein
VVHGNKEDKEEHEDDFLGKTLANAKEGDDLPKAGKSAIFRAAIFFRGNDFK